MKTYVHDNSFDGRLSALAAALADAQTPEDILPEQGRQASLFGTDVKIQGDEAAAAELLRRIRADIYAEAVRHVLYALLSDLPAIDLPLYFYLREGMTRGPAVDRWHAHPAVKKVHDVSRRVGGEIHRLKGLLRFRELDGGALWAPVEPDHLVLPQLAHHFRRRLPVECGIIHDVRRGVAIRWEAGGVHYIDPPESFRMADGEPAVQRLWQTYFSSAVIRERINPRLQRQCMPVRYWKWLTEIQSGADDNR